MTKNNLGNKEIFSSNLKSYLDKEGLNPKDFSRKMNFKYSTVLDWVNGKTYPRIDKIELMARYFKIDKSDLIEQYTENKEETIDLKNTSAKKVAFDGREFDEDDLDFMNYVMESYFKNKYKD